MKNKFGVIALIISFLPWILAYFLQNIWFIFSWDLGLTFTTWFDKNLFNPFTVIFYIIAGIISITALKKKEQKLYPIFVFVQILIFGLWMLFAFNWSYGWSHAIL